MSIALRTCLWRAVFMAIALGGGACGRILGDFPDGKLATPTDDLALYVSPSHGSDANDGRSATAPFATLEAAQKAARTYTRTRSLTVYLMDNWFPRTSTLKLTKDDAPADGQKLTFKAYQGTTPVLSAGLPVGPWTLQSNSSSVYFAQVPDGAWLYDLWAAPGSSESLHRSRHPNFPDWVGDNLPAILQWAGGPTFDIHLPLQFSYGGQTLDTLPPATGPTVPPLPTELVSSEGWAASRIPIANYQNVYGVLVVSAAAPAGAIEFDPSKTPSSHAAQNDSLFFLEGTFPDAPGEFAFDGRYHFVYLDEATGAPQGTFYVGSGLETLVDLADTSNIEFDGIQFRHTSFGAADQGFIGQGAGHIYGAGSPLTSKALPAAVTIEGSSGISFTHCTFADLGANAIDLAPSTAASNPALSSNVTIRGSSFAGVAGTAVDATGVSTLEVSHSRFQNIGLRYAASAINLLYTSNFTVANDSFDTGGASAIYALANPFAIPPLPGNNSIAANVVSNQTLLVTNVGAIESAGGPWSIRDNWIDGVQPSHFVNRDQGYNVPIGLEVGTRGVAVQNNAVTHSSGFIQANCQGENDIRKNSTAASGSHPAVSTADVPLEMVTYIGCERSDPSWAQANAYIDQEMTTFGVNGSSGCNQPHQWNCGTSTTFVDNVGGADAAAIISGAGP